MIVVAGEFYIGEDSIETVRAAMIEMAAETAKEDGCIHYRFYQDVEFPDRFHVYEEWESDAHLAAHAASDHMQVYRGKLANAKMISRDVKKMSASDVKTL